MLKNVSYNLFAFLFLFLYNCKRPEPTNYATTPLSYIAKKITIPDTDILETISLLKKDSLTLFSIKNKDSVIAFYKLNKGNAAWQLIENRQALYKSILNSYLHGLNPKDYNETKIKSIVSENVSKTINNAAIDLFLTDNYLSYAYHLANGKIKPESLYNDWKLKPNHFNFNKILLESLINNNVTESLLKFSPNDSIYNRIKKELPVIKNKINIDSLKTTIAYGPKIKPLKNDKRIINIRKRLNELGYLNDSLVTKNKKLDTLLQKSIINFQASKKIRTDAIIGDETIKALNESFKDNYYSLLANLERLRWYPRQKGSNNIIVNIADYKLNYFTQKDTTTYNVIVGKTSRKTPVFSSKVNYLDFNPKWFIPPTIKKEDIIPAASENIEYLTKKNITVYNNGKKVTPDSIDWNTTEPLKYSYVQSSGKNNALGRVKIIFPNDFSVYLHDTPNKILFKKKYRAKSSGCVRVENVSNLASELLNTSQKKIIDIINSNQTKRIYVKDTINVHFLYWTVNFDQNSRPIFLNDVYNLDKKLAEKLIY